MTVVAGSGHFAGFIGQYEFLPAVNGVGSLYNWDNGLPAYPLPPLIDPSFWNNNTVDHWQPQDAARAPESYYWTFSAQRQLSTNSVFEVACNANVGAHLQAGLVNLNQVPTAIWQSYVNKLGVTQATALFTAQATSALAQSNGIVLPYPQFADPAIQTTQRTVSQSLRPFPQYLNINTGAQGGDKSGHSSYHAMTIRMDRRFSGGLTFQWNYTFSKILTDSDTYSAGNGTSQDQHNRRAEKSIGQFDQTHALIAEHSLRTALGEGSSLDEQRRCLAHFGWLAGERYSDVLERFPGRAAAQQSVCFTSVQWPDASDSDQL